MARKLLLEKIGVEGIRTFDVYRREGGYRSVEKALKQMSPDQVTDEVKKSGPPWARWCRISNGYEMEFYC